MHSRWTYLFSSILILTWLCMSIWLLPTADSIVEKLALSLYLLGLSSLLFWLVYFFLLSVIVLPRIDHLAHPDDHAARCRNPDNLILKALRINIYTAALRQKNARDNPLAAMLRELPADLKTPLRFQIGLLSLSIAAILAGFITWELFL